MNVIKEPQVRDPPSLWEEVHDTSLLEKFGQWLRLATKSSLAHQSPLGMSLKLKAVSQKAGHSEHPRKRVHLETKRKRL